jgi:heptosyltransferase-3
VIVSAGQPTRILFVVVSRIGDTMFATPAIRALARAWPAARITVLGHPNRAEVLAHLPFVETVGTITKKSAPWRGRFGRKQFDLAVVCGFDKPLVAYAQRVANRVVAFAQGDPALDAKLDPAVALPPFQSEHAVRQLLRLSSAAGAAPAGERLTYTVTDVERDAARAQLDAVGFGAASPLIGLQVASFPTKAYRDWPVSSFEELCARLNARWPAARFLIFGGSEEKQRTNWLADRLGKRCAVFAGRLSLRETAALMSQTDLYVGVDTGPTHLMSTFDIPLVGLYHCLSPASLTGPLEHPCAYLTNHPQTGAACSEADSMADISVDTVFADVVRALTDHPPAARVRP